MQRLSPEVLLLSVNKYHLSRGGISNSIHEPNWQNSIPNLTPIFSIKRKKKNTWYVMDSVQIDGRTAIFNR